MAPNPYQQVNAYGNAQKAQAEVVADGNSRDVDARALLSCANHMHEALEALRADKKSKTALKAYGDAIRHNQRLWTIFQAALTDPENPLPQDLKRTLLNLSAYVDKTSLEAVGKPEFKMVESMININRVLAAGLSKKPALDASDATNDEAAPKSVATSA